MNGADRHGALECGDSSPLSQNPALGRVRNPRPRALKSGDKSPHSKAAARRRERGAFGFRISTFRRPPEVGAYEGLFACA